MYHGTRGTQVHVPGYPGTGRISYFIAQLKFMGRFRAEEATYSLGPGLLQFSGPSVTEYAPTALGARSLRGSYIRLSAAARPVARPGPAARGPGRPASDRI
eukprot:280287-Rhodomonas_salina.1